MTVSTKTKILDELAELYKLCDECITNETLKTEILSKMDETYWLIFDVKVTEETK